jgi:hypothetical protein
MTVILKEKAGSRSIFVKSDTKISEIIKNYLVKLDVNAHFHFVLTYAGKVLKPKLSFKEELVENGAEIAVINIKEYAVNKISQKR